MEEIKLTQEALEQVAGGKSSQRFTVEIYNCKHRINVRKTPSGEAELAGYAHLGDRYLCFGWEGNWAKVAYKNGIAYIYKQFIKIV